MESELLRTQDTVEVDMDFLQPPIPDCALGKEGVQGPWKEKGTLWLILGYSFPIREHTQGAVAGLLNETPGKRRGLLA